MEETKIINWFHFLDDLNDAFFKKGDYIVSGTKQYDEFLVFLQKYQLFMANFNKKTSGSSQGFSPSQRTNRLDLPVDYHRRYRVNNYIICRPLPKGSKLTEKMHQEFKDILAEYENFRQMRNFKQLKTLRRSQASLPIAAFREAIKTAVSTNQVTIIAADTGAGKSTQVPQYLLEMGYTGIACTQPRRIACISLAKRVSFETLNVYDTEIAYQIRFDTSKTRKTKILFLTEGLLLRQLASDPLLSKYELVIMDEVHERNIYCDFLLGMMKSLLCKRADLKLILMSATINIDLFSLYFQSSPIIQVPGRLYDIEVRYKPSEAPMEIVEKKLDTRPYIRLLEEIDQTYPITERGDVLVFMSGVAEIHSLFEEVTKFAEKSQQWIVLPLHSLLSFAEQDKVFESAPEGKRKCIISTNIAETSITIDGIRFVIDSGKVKEMAYDSKVNMQRLTEYWISQASAEQRKGRAGRTGPGVCFRLYDNNDYQAFSRYSTPEIQRVPIVSMLLQIKVMTNTDPRTFDFIEPPNKDDIELGLDYLKKNEAIHEVTEHVTVLGKVLSKLPISIPLGKMLIFATVLDIIKPTVSIAALLSVQSPFITKHIDSQSEAYEFRHKFDSKHGDAFTLYSAYNEWLKVKSESKEQSKLWCRKHSIEEQRFYEVSKLIKQFEDILIDNKLIHYNLNTTEVLKEKRYKKTISSRKRKHDEDELYLKPGDSESSSKLLSNNELNGPLAKDNNTMQTLEEKEIFLLQLILVCGLYPHIAVPDSANRVRRPTELVYHSQLKPLLVLHPTSVFYSKPEYIDQSGPTIKDFLCYMSLLETKKPYLINCVRIPSFHYLLMFARSIEADATCQHLLIDSWLGLTIKESYKTAEALLLLVVRIRYWWNELLSQKLKSMEPSLSSPAPLSGAKHKPVASIKTKLSRELVEFYKNFCGIEHAEDHMANFPKNNETSEGVKAKLTSAIFQFLSLKITHKFVKVKQSELEEFLDLEEGTNKCISPRQGNGEGLGLALSDFCRVGSLKKNVAWTDTGHLFRKETLDESKEDPLDQKEAREEKVKNHVEKETTWRCSLCLAETRSSLQKFLVHLKNCLDSTFDQFGLANTTEDESKVSVTSGNSETTNVRRNFYFCTLCDSEYNFSAIEILKHKRSHQKLSE